MNLVRRLFTLLLNPRTAVLPVEAGMRPGGNSGGQARANGPLLLGLVIVGALLVITLLGPLWVSYDPYLGGVTVLPHFDVETMKFIRPPFSPSAAHWLGTDRWGNDILSQIVHGARLTLVGASVITFSRLLLGTLLGSLAGWWAGRLADRLVMALIAVLTALPSLISAFLLVMVLGAEKGLPSFLIALALLGWTEVAQYVRGELMVIREQPYIEGAESIGLTDLQLVVRHVWPNLLPSLVVLAFLEMGTVLILLAELGFLGVFMGGTSFIQLDPFGGPIWAVPETPEWGLLVAHGEAYIRSAPYVVLGPALAFFITVLGFNALGEGLRGLLDRAGVSTAFLLKRRMLLVVPLLLLGTALLLTYTGPRLSYGRLADSFSRANIPTYRERLEAAANTSQAAELLAQTFDNMGLEPGMTTSGQKHYVEERTSQQVVLARPPQLDVLGPDWTPLIRLDPDSDFTFEVGGGAGPGEVVAPLTFVHFAADNPDAELVGLEGLDLEGRVLMLSNAPEDLALLPLYRGARAVLLISDRLNPPALSSEQRTHGLVFRVQPRAAAKILAQEDLDMDSLIASTAGGAVRVIAETSLVLHLSLYLDKPHTAQFPVVAGYLPGYDLEHADELLVVLANFDGLHPDGVEAGTVPLLLELARSWHARNVAPRRSVLFLAWGGPPEAATEVLQRDSFRALASLVPAPATHTTAIVHLGPDDGADLWISPDGSVQLQYQFKEALRRAGAKSTQRRPANNGDLDVQHPDYVYLQGSAEEEGRVTSLALIRLARVTEQVLPQQESAATASD